jgi:hypothetical protein
MACTTLSLLFWDPSLSARFAFAPLWRGTAVGKHSDDGGDGGARKWRPWRRPPEPVGGGGRSAEQVRPVAALEERLLNPETHAPRTLLLIHYSASLAVTQDLVARSLRRGGMDSATDGAVSRSEVEGRRVRVELASVRSGSTSTSLPPSGREFDVAPDPADEAAYDALEKAYNLAFAVCPPERLTRSQDSEQREQQREM